MDSITVDEERLVRGTVEKFWEAIPFVWGHIRAHIREEAAQSAGITVEQFQILRRIHAGVDLVSKLAEARQISRAGASRVVDGLAQRGLVERRQNPDDRREIYLSLSAEGEALMNRVYDQTRDWMAQYLSALDLDALANLNRALSDLKFAFEQASGQEG